VTLKKLLNLVLIRLQICYFTLLIGSLFITLRRAGLYIPRGHNFILVLRFIVVVKSVRDGDRVSMM